MHSRLTVLLLCWALPALRAPAADIYVATNAAPAAPYTNWSGAFTNLQQALDYARTNTGEAVTNIYLAGHIFQGTGTNYPGDTNSVFTWQNCANQNLRGGYAATNNDTPGARGTNWPTILRRSSGSARVLIINNLSNCLLEQLIICNGAFGSSGDSTNSGFGTGALLIDCQAIVFADCSITNNINDRLTHIRRAGGGLYLTNSTVTLTNCLLAANGVQRVGYSGDPCGGGAFVSTGSRLIVAGSIVRNNYIYSDTAEYGGAFYVGTNGILEIRETVISGNLARQGGSKALYGGAIANAGTLSLRNCLIVSNASEAPNYGDGIYSAGSSATTLIFNCTIADNASVGLVNNNASVFAVSNSIIWGHAKYDFSGFPTNAAGVLSNVWYCAISQSQNEGAQGCQTIDPCFVDRVYYHLPSTLSNYSGGYFSGGSWATSAVSSPLIDRGDPAADYSHEPDPNGGRLNLGAYGNTEVASLTPTNSVSLPQVLNLGATVGHRTAVLRGAITNDGGAAPEVTFYYWTNSATDTNVVYVGLKSDIFSHAIAGLTPGVTGYYYFAATNQAGATNSAVNAFMTHASAAPFYAATNGDNTAGTNWATAHTNLQAVLNLIEEGDTLYLAGHTFAGAPPSGLDYSIFTWQNATNITLCGGYAATNDSPGERNFTNWPTVLQVSSGSARVMLLNNLANCVLEQLAIRNGSNDVNFIRRDNVANGLGVYLASCTNVVFRTCELCDNGSTGVGTVWHLYGGGLYLANSAVTLTNCLVNSNGVYAYQKYTTTAGGGAYIDGGSRLTLRNSVVRGNCARCYNGSGGIAYGGAFYVVAGGTLELYETLIASNNTPGAIGSDKNHGGAIYNAGTLTMRNCLVASNWTATANYCDGIYSTGDGTLASCTVAGNNKIGIQRASGRISITNSIIWGHAQVDLLDLPIDSQWHLATVFHALFSSAKYSGLPVPPMQGVNGCVVADPQFTNAAAGDYRLLAASPAIDGGTNLSWMIGATDLDGVRRIRGRVVDLGAYEAAPRRGTVWKMR